MSKDDYEWDAFISHASEDKEGFVRPLASALLSLGARIWYDEFSLRLGDSLSSSIDKGLAQSRFGVVVVSPAFIGKAWTTHELRGLVARQIDGKSSILPIWHHVTRAEVSDFSPPLADQVAVLTSDASASDIALQILNVVRPDLYAAHPRADLIKRANGEALAELEGELEGLREQLVDFQCPYCKAALATSIQAPVDPEERDWDIIREFECGYSDFGAQVRRLCPRDPRFPKLSEYELLTHQEGPSFWICSALPKTEAARMVQLLDRTANDREAAIREMQQEYEQAATPRM